MEGFRLTVYTDHDMLKQIFNRTESTGILARWWLEILSFELDVVHCTRVKHQAAEELSQVNTTETN